MQQRYNALKWRETYLIIPAGDIRINFLTILLYFIANSNASNPPNDDPIIITSDTFKYI